MDVPDCECFSPLLFGRPRVCVEELFGEDPVVPFHLAVVSRCVGRDSLMPRPEEGAIKYVGAIARSVVGDDPLDVDDAMRFEPGVNNFPKLTP